MPAYNHDLHGNVPDKSDVAILLIDVLNDLEFASGEELLGPALAMAESLSKLVKRARRLGIPIIYVNDNFGKWRSDFRQQLAHCLENDVRGRPVVEMLKPQDDDYFVLKPKNSGFYHTTLALLLEYLRVKTVIITGIATNNCVQLTASDAYMRDLKVIVPRDCVAAAKAEDHEHALEQMREVLKAGTAIGSSLDLRSLAGSRRRTPPKKMRRASSKHGASGKRGARRRPRASR
jgi:nicotinamidase-related amidase